MARILTGLIISTVLLAACASDGGDREGSLSLSRSPLIGKFVWHDLITDQVQASRRFYGAVLGWTFEEATRPGGGDYTLVVSDGKYIGGMVPLADHPQADYSRWLGYLSVDDVDAAFASIKQGGGSSIVDPREVGNVGRAAAVRDPQGAVLGLLRSDHGDPVDTTVTTEGAVGWNELVASDADAAAGFYEQLLGYQERIESRKGGQYIVLSQGGRPRAGVMQRPDDRIEPLWLTYFAVTNVAASARTAVEAGGEVLIEPSASVRDGTIAIIRGPEGAVFGLQQIRGGGAQP